MVPKSSLSGKNSVKSGEMKVACSLSKWVWHHLAGNVIDMPYHYDIITIFGWHDVIVIFGRVWQGVTNMYKVWQRCDISSALQLSWISSAVAKILQSQGFSWVTLSWAEPTSALHSLGQLSLHISSASCYQAELSWAWLSLAPSSAEYSWAQLAGSWHDSKWGSWV